MDCREAACVTECICERFAFKIRPLNNGNDLPRKKWSPSKPPRRVKQMLEEEREAVRNLGEEDTKLYKTILHRNRDKRKTVGKQSAVARKELQKNFVVNDYKWRPQARRATEGPVSETHHANSLLSCAEPQMFGLSNIKVSLDEDILDSVESLTNVASDLAKVIGDATVKVKLDQSNLDTLQCTTDNLSDFAMLVLVIAIVCVVKPKTTMEKSLIIAMVMGFLAHRFSLKDLIKNSSLFSLFTTKEEDAVLGPQAGVEFHRRSEELATMVTSLINMWVCASFGRDLFDPKRFMVVTNQLGRSTSTVNGIIKGMNLVVGYIFDEVNKFLGKSPVFCKTGYDFIDNFLKEYNSIVDDFEGKKLHNLQSSVERVRSAIEYGNDINRKIPGSPEFRGLGLEIAAAVRELEKIRKALMASNFQFSGIRKEPASMLMRGAPGVFKSQAMQHVTNKIAAKVLSPEEYKRYLESPTSFSHNRQAENVYWDGYRPDQPFVFFDDILQQRDIQGNPDNEAMNAIRAINIFENQLHMAAIEGKGNSNFRSDFVLANTNMFNFKLESIHEIGAFLRRWDIVVDVCPRSEYSINPTAAPGARRFDPTKYPKYSEDDCLDNPDLIGLTRTHPDMCEYWVQRLNKDYTGFESTGDVYTFDQLVEAYYNVHLKKTRYHKAYLRELDKSLRDARAAAFPEEKTWEPQSEGATPNERYSAPQIMEEQVASLPSSIARYEEELSWSLLWRLGIDAEAVQFIMEVNERERLNAQFMYGCLKAFPFQFRQRAYSYLLAYFDIMMEELGVDFDMDWGDVDIYHLDEPITFDFLSRLLDRVKNGIEDIVDVDVDVSIQGWSFIPSIYAARVYAPQVGGKLEVGKLRMPKLIVKECKYIGTVNVALIKALGLAPSQERFLTDLFTHQENDARFFFGIVMMFPINNSRLVFDLAFREFEEMIKKDDSNFVWFRKSIYSLGTPIDGCFQRSLLSRIDEEYNSIVRSHFDWNKIRLWSFTEKESPEPQMNRNQTSEPLDMDVVEERTYWETVRQYTALGGDYPVPESYLRELLKFKYTECEKWIIFDTLMKMIWANAQIYDKVLYLDQFYKVVLENDFDVLLKMQREGLLDLESVADEILAAYYDAVEPNPRKRIDRSLWKSISEIKIDVDPWQQKIMSLYRQCFAFLIDSGSRSCALVRSIQTSPSLKRSMGGVLLGAGALLGAFKVARYFVTTLFGGPQSDERRGRIQRTRVTRGVKPHITKENLSAGSPQSVARVNENMTAVMRKILRTSQFDIFFPRTLDERTEDASHALVGTGLGIRGRSVLIPYHFGSVLQNDLQDKVIKEDDLVELRRCGTSGTYFWMTVVEFLNSFVHWDRGEQQDLALLRMPRRFQPVKDIVKHIATEKQHSLYTNVDAVLVVSSETMPEMHSIMAKRAKNARIDTSEFHPYVVRELYEYRAYTCPGDCGSVLYVNDKCNSAPLMGMHVAGITPKKWGFSSKISREFIVEFLEIAGEDYVEIDQLGLELEECDNRENVIPLGKAAPHCRFPRRQTESAIVPSPLKDKIIPSPKAPAMLKPFTGENGERIDPMRIALDSYCTPDVYIKEEWVVSAKESLVDYLMANSNEKVEKKIYSFEEAVLGDGPGSEFASVPRTTSAGYPYNCDGGPTSKSRFFGTGVDYDLSSSDCAKLRSEVDEILENAKKGIRMTHVFTDALKDERRSWSKVKAGKTRMFAGSPTPLLIASRMMFGAFQKWMVRNRIHNGCAIGINEYSSEWALVAEMLNSKGPGRNKGAGDYVGFDFKAKSVIYWAICDIINDWYDDGDKNRRVREILWLELVNSLHVNEGVFYLWPSSLPSGHPLTIIMNCLNNHMLFRLCWISLIRPRSGDASEFNKYIYLIVLGDDNLFSVAKPYDTIFTEKALQKTMKLFGQDYAPEDKNKTEFDENLRSLEEVTFLKRSFRIHERTGRYMAPLDLDTILDIPNWTKKGANVYGDTETNVKIALEELTLHGRTVFEKWRRKIVRAIEDTPGLSQPESTSFDVLFSRILERDGEAIVHTRFITDYDDELGNTAAIEELVGRFDERRAGLFSSTSRMARWQPHLYPGNRGTPRSLVRRVVFKRTANTNDNNNTNVTDNESVGMKETGILSVVRGEGIRSDLNSSTLADQNSGETVVGRVEKYIPLDQSLLDSAFSGVNASLADFFRKPVRIRTGLLQTTDTPATALISWATPHDIIYNHQMWREKLYGYFAFRGDLHLTFMVNGNRFQQGRYMLCWVPTGGAQQRTVKMKMHVTSLVQRTQVPHVELDVSCDSEATMVVPHVTSQGWGLFRLGAPTSHYGCNGFIILYAYSPLVAPSGSTNCNYSIFAHWENVQLAMPISPQSGRRIRTRVKRRVGIADSEARSQGVGPIESTARSISMTAAKFMGIPLLSSVAGQVQWASDLAGRVASAFGWSRPHNGEHASLGSLSIMSRYTNCDVVDNSTKLGYFDRNEVEDLPSFAGIDLDEMNLNYIASTGAWFRTLTWNTSAAPDDVLVALNLTPREFYSSSIQGTKVLYHLTPLAFVSGFFGLWRGSFKFTFKIVKTEFHTGRLMFVFWPADYAVNSGTNANMNAANSCYVHREIIDIREGHEFTVVVPYTSISQYKTTQGFDKSFGTVQLIVINELVAPATVSSSVSILCEIAAGEDFEWAQPCDFPGRVSAPWNPQSGRRNTCEISSSVVGNGVVSTSDAPARLCIGERVVSFRSILKRFSNLVRYFGLTSPTNDMIFLNFVPWATDVVEITNANAIIDSTMRPDMFTLISSCYALYRGSMRMKFIDQRASSGATMMVQSFPLPSNGLANVDNFTWSTAPSWLTQFDINNNRSSTFTRPDITGGVEIEFPYYNRFPSTPVGDLMASGTAGSIKYSTTGCVPLTGGVLKYNYTGDVLPPSTTNPLVMRAMGEDGSLGLFISVPPIIDWTPDWIG